MNQLFYGLVCMNLLFVTSAVCVVKPSTWSVAATVFSAVAWLFFNGPLEGNVLISINREHGLTVSDLLSFVAIAVAARGWMQHRGLTGNSDTGRPAQ
ncbi:hypothetical protein ABH922_003747 [Rhodococcus sp. 27YEA15]|uniref:hypothetical protein n=1 Tax=Rhodococcus sp. 27YEA15 TaxID=3156259 RepID=UPI003C7AC637